MALFASQTLLAETNSLDWGYKDQQAPEHWANINEKYHACAGVNQSPINIDQSIDAELPPLNFKGLY